MKTKPILLCLIMITVSFAGCFGGNGTVVTEEGEPITPGELPDDWPTYYVATANDLPTCDANTLGRLYYVEADTNFQACTSNGWTVVQIGGTTSTTTLTMNHPPTLSVEIWMADDDYMSFDGDGTATFHIWLDWHATDSDGNITSLGVDIDNDGIIDLPLASDSGVLTQETSNEFPNGSVQIPLEVGNTFYRAENFDEYQCALILSKRITVHAIDDGGATTSTELVLTAPGPIRPNIIDSDFVAEQGVNTAYGIPANDVAWLLGASCASQTPTGSNNQYNAEDHPSATSDQMTDNLLRLSFTNAPDDLEWALLTITLFDEEDGKTYMCTPGGADCTVTEETADSIWKANEIIGIAEGGSTDICGAAGGAEGNSCELKIQISYNGVTLSGTSGIVAVA